MKWFNNPETLEELKKQYKRLALKHHPDLGGNTQDMQEINNEYDKLFEILKNTHKSAAGKVYTAKESTTETPSEFREIINKLINLAGIDIEICGSWLWLTGNTKEHNAYKWENAAKAKNALECLPNKIKKQSSFQMMIIETQHTQINKDFLKNKSFITNYINSFSIENLPDDSLYSALNKIEIALIDYRHFVELGRFNIFEAYTCMIVFQQLLLYRRQIKDRLSLLKGWASPSELFR